MPRIEVVAGIVWRTHKGLREYLAVRRPEGKVQAGWWEFPGGKIEAGEDAATALIRELREELGLEARAPRFWQSLHHSYAPTAQDQGRQICLHFFHVDEFAGEAQALEGQQLRWIVPAQGLDLPFLAADVPIVQDLCAAQRQA